MGDQGEMENVDVHTNPFLEIINLLVVDTVQVLFFVFKKKLFGGNFNAKL